jgi:hypothetical protein
MSNQNDGAGTPVVKADDPVGNTGRTGNCNNNNHNQQQRQQSRLKAESHH